MSIIRLAALFLVALSLTSCKDEGKEEILDIFAAYKVALRDNDGEAAVALLDEKYFEDFRFVLTAARSASREKVFRMRPSERFRIAALRNRLTPQELKTLDARAALAAIIDRGSDNSSDRSIQLGRITFKPPRAFAFLYIDGIETKFRIDFIKASNIWKLDPTCFDEDLDYNIGRLAHRTNRPEDAIILEYESSGSGKRVTDSIWDPPQ